MASPVNTEARRTIIRYTALGVLGLGLVAATGCSVTIQIGDPNPSGRTTVLAGDPTKSGSIALPQSSEPQSGNQPNNQKWVIVTPTAEKFPQLNKIGNLSSMAGIPQSVDRNVVDTAKGLFVNTIGLGTEGWFAEPGKLLVGPDFPQAKIDAAGGTIERINPVNQKVFETDGPSKFNTPEGGFMLASGNHMTVKVGGATIRLDGQPGHNWLLVVRGRNSDGKPDVDLNETAVFTGYTAGHIMAMNYSGKVPGGFISEGQLKQIAVTSHTNGTNCGADGCTRLSMAMYDINTGAFAVVTQNGVNGSWQKVYSNFATR